MILKSLRRKRTEPAVVSVHMRSWRRTVLIGGALTLVMVGMLSTFAGGIFFHRSGGIHQARIWAEIHTDLAYWRGFFNTERLPTLTVDMSFRNLQKIEAKRKDALRRGILISSEEDFVSAQLRFEGRIISVKMRLKGDTILHLQGDKWSFRIEVKDDDQLLGMRRFSIQDPRVRNYLFEWGYLEHLRTEDVLAPKYQFVEVIFNGDDLGIYAVEEHFSKEFLESQGRREGVIVRFNEDLFWEQKALNSPDHRIGNVFKPLYTGAIIDAFRDVYIEKSRALVAQRDAAIGLLRGYTEGKLAASDVFDVELVARYMAITDLWDAGHATAWNNIRFSYNPVTAKLEPVGFDAYPFRPWLPPDTGLIGLGWMDLTDDLVISEAYVRELFRLSSPAYIDSLRGHLAPEYERLRKVLFREFGSLPAPWESLQRRRQVITNLLDPVVTIFAFRDRDYVDAATQSKDTIQIELRNVLSLPVEVLGFSVNGGELILAGDALAVLGGKARVITRGSTVVLSGTEATREALPRELVLFRIPVKPLDFPQVNGLPQDARIEVVTRILGLTEWHSEPVIRYPKALSQGLPPESSSVEEALAAHPFLEAGGKVGTLVVKPGEWYVSGDLVLPRRVGLEIGPGTTLLFESGAVLYSSGALDFHGTPEAPVVLGPEGTSWGGIIVFTAKRTSKWTNVRVLGTSSVARGGWMLTGGITFYESPVILQQCQILGSFGEDALNIVRTEFEIRACEFGDTTSDAFDGDFATGRVLDSSFHDIAGDAIDLGGSVVEINNVWISRVADKGISVGEASSVTVRDTRIEEIGIGIASKDLSHVTGNRITIVHALNAGLAAYTKKAEYGPGDMNLDLVEFIDTRTKTLVDLDSWIFVNGSLVQGTAFDADILGN